MRFALALFLLASPAHAKSTSWWDCFFREFEHCSGRAVDPNAPEKERKSTCDGQARSTCEEEEEARTIKPGGQSANTAVASAKGKGGSTITVAGDATASSGSNIVVYIEGLAPSGDRTVLGVDVTLSISEMAQTYKSRNIHGCRTIDDPFSRMLCLDAPGGKGGAPIELEFYRGRLVSLNYEAPGEAAVEFNAAIAVAEDKTGAKAAVSSQVPDSKQKSKFCFARFPLGGGTLILHAQPTSTMGDSCDANNIEKANIVRVEWAPSHNTQLEIANLRKVDSKPTAQEKKRKEIDAIKAKLPL